MSAVGAIGTAGTDEIAASDAAGKGFAGRTAVALKMAGRLNDQADRLEPSVASAIDGLRSVDRGMAYSGRRGEAQPE